MSRMTAEFEVPRHLVLGWIAEAGETAELDASYVLRMQAAVVEAGRCAIGTFDGAQTGGRPCPAGAAGLQEVGRLGLPPIPTVQAFASAFDKLADAYLAERSEDYVLYPVLVLT